MDPNRQYSRTSVGLITYNHADHVGGQGATGLETVVEQYSIGTMHFSGVRADTDTQDNLDQLVENSGVPTSTLERGDGHKITPMEDSYGVSVLNPRQGEAEEIEDPDSRILDKTSIVLKVEHGDNTIVLSSDIRDNREEWLVKNSDLDATILQASHHGSASGNSEMYLDATDPSYVIISSESPDIGDNPDAKTLGRISNHTTAKVGWTADGEHHGTITFNIAKEKVTDEQFETEFIAATDPDVTREIIKELE